MNTSLFHHGMTTRLSRRAYLPVAVMAVLPMFGAGLPAAAAAPVAASAASASGSAASSAVVGAATNATGGARPVLSSAGDIRLIGGTGSGKVVCGNVADAQNLARQHGLAIQRANCTANATGGTVTLNHVDITITRAARALSRGNAMLAALASGGTPGYAVATCGGHRDSHAATSVQINECVATGRGGRVQFNNLNVVNQVGGKVSARTISSVALPTDSGDADANCTNRNSDELARRDDCVGSGTGGSLNLRGVDVTLHNADGSTTTRRGINVVVQGGSANADVYCFNVTDGSGHVVQINRCRANAQGGDARLNDVTVHSVS